MGILASYFCSQIFETTFGDDVELSHRGVRLEVLQKICKEVEAGRLQVPADDKERSPGERIVDGLVKPVTDTRKCSFATHLLQEPSTRNLVGKCNTFVSHPWSADFQVTVAALVEYEKALPKGSTPKFYFVDYFAVNQHSPSNDLKQLADLVGLSDTLVLMARPWENPVALTRLWCIFEIAHAVLSSTEIEIILCPEEIKNFQHSLRTNIKDSWELLGELFKNIDSRNATASKESDIEKIGQFIENELGGFIKVDTIVADGLRNWFIRSAKALLKNFPDDDKGSNEHAGLIWQVALFHYSQSQYPAAVRLFDEAAIIFKKNNNDQWLTCEKDSIFMFRKMGKLKEALPMADLREG